MRALLISLLTLSCAANAQETLDEKMPMPRPDTTINHGGAII